MSLGKRLQQPVATIVRPNRSAMAGSAGGRGGDGGGGESKNQSFGGRAVGSGDAIGNGLAVRMGAGLT